MSDKKVESVKTQAKGLARGGVLSFAGAAASAALGFIVTVVYSRGLGTAGAGVVMSGIGIFSIALSLTRCGLDSTAIWLMPRLKAAAPGLIRPAIRFILGVCLAVSLAAGIWLVWLAPWLSDEAGGAEALRWVAPFLPFAAGTLVLLAVSRGLGGLRPYILIGSIGLPVLRLAGVGLLVGYGVEGALLGWAAPTVIALTLALVVVTRLARETGTTSSRPRIPAGLRRVIIGFAWPRTISSGLEQALLWLDVVLVGLLAGSQAAGVYGGASRFIAAGLVVDTAIRVVVSPRFSALMQRNQLERLQELYSIAAGWLMFFSTPIFVILAIFGQVVLSWLGPGFATGATALTILCTGSLITLAAGNIHSVLLMSGRSAWAAGNKAVVLAANVCGNLLLVPRLGVEGAAISWAVAMFADALLASIQVRYFIGVGIRLAHVGYAGLVPLICVGGPALAARQLLGATSAPAMWVSIMAGGLILAAWGYLDRRRLGFQGVW